MLYNEASEILIEYIKKNKIDLQLTPPYCHHRNLAERVMRTFKEHFKSLRAACDPRFPRHIWCRLLPQATLILKILRTSRLHPQFSEYHALITLRNVSRATTISGDNAASVMMAGQAKTAIRPFVTRMYLLVVVIGYSVVVI